MIFQRLSSARLGPLGGFLCGFLAALFAFGDVAHFLAFVAPRPAVAQSAFAPAFRLMDGAHVQLATVDHSGRLLVSTGSTSGLTDHITSVTHMIGSVRLMSGTPNNQLAVVTHSGALTVTCQTAAGVAESCAGSGGGDTVNVFHQSTVRHVSSVTHVAGSVRLISGTPNNQAAVITHFGALAVTCYTSAGAAESCGGTAGGGDTVNVFHQSTIRHVSGSLHIAGTINGAQFHIQGLGTPGASHGGVLTVQGIAGGNAVTISQSTALWNINHISAAVHLAGGVTDNANSALRVTGVTVFTVMGAIDHISSQVHLAGLVGDGAGRPPQLTVKQGQPGSIAAWPVSAHQAGQSGNIWRIDHITSVLHVQVAGTGIPAASLSVRCVNTGGTAFADCGGTVTSDVVNVFHQSTIRHVSSETHISGALMLRDKLCLSCVARIDHTGALATTATVTVTTDNVNVFHQSTIRHISSVTHVALAEHAVIRVMGAHLTGTIHVAGISNVGSGAPNTGTTQMVCHSTLAVHVAAAAPGYTQLIHLTSSNNGIDQSGWRIYICGIVLVSAHAQAFSLLEGTGTTCATGKRPVIGAWRPDDAFVMAANGGFSAVAAFPWISTQNPGNNLCLVQTSRTSGSVSGVISYRAGP